MIHEISINHILHIIGAHYTKFIKHTNVRAESALEQEENKVMRSQLELGQVRQEIVPLLVQQQELTTS